MREDTERLAVELASRKADGQRLLERADQLKQLGRHRRAESLLKQHRLIWEQHLGHLRSAEVRLQREVYGHLVACAQISPPDPILTDIIADILDLEDDRSLFKDNVVDPLWHLSTRGTGHDNHAGCGREDLQTWVRHYRESQPVREHLRLHHQHVQEEVQSVWIRYHEMASLLDQELRDVEISIPSYCVAAVKEVLGGEDEVRGSGVGLSVLRGVPVEFQELWCPDPKQKDLFLQDLSRIDDSYRSRLQDVEAASKKQLSATSMPWNSVGHPWLVLCRPRPPSWQDIEIGLFRLIMEQYPADLNDRRVLLFDRLKRTFPTKTLAQLMGLESWLQGQRFHKDRRLKTLEDWARERWAWLLRSVAAVAAIHQALEARQAFRQEALTQKALCHQLRQKVLLAQVEEWRKQRDVDRRQRTLQERQRQAALRAAQQAAAAREERRRVAARHKLQGLYQARLVQQRQAYEAMQTRLEELRQLARLRSIHDRDRVQYRTQLFYQQLQDRQARRLKLKEELRIRELKLEALRKKVRVEAPPDPARVLQATAASQAREQASPDSKPIFEPLCSYPDKEIWRDPRVRLESHLRDSGLLNSEYARQVIHSLRPLARHRKDMVPSLEVAPPSPRHLVSD
ncbi:CCDC148 [Cordylochernes scorpioides]|uniref:CCDC148 n=1 Tax=Cordylochernes scorpioides TaxID=51811 RepID=A0ABY6LEJ2_9ARAC|nr:CCDC148 [Cordylochernes scorpioides]